MKKIFDNYSNLASEHVTKTYSTSFYAGVRFLDSKIRNDIHAIYGLVRFADEIVDSFHGYNKEVLLDDFKKDTFKAIEEGVSLNPILNSFQHTIRKYDIDLALVSKFFESMEMDLNPVEYNQELYKKYINGSAEVVGLMCLKVFVYGDQKEYERLKCYAMKLGSAFQKINFLRDISHDLNDLGRNYFPDNHDAMLTYENKKEIEREIEIEFREAYKGIVQLPKSSRFGVYVSYIYYLKLLRRIKRKSIKELMTSRIRVSNNHKIFLFFKSYLRNSLNLL